MKNWNNEVEARKKIKKLVAEYYQDFNGAGDCFVPGDRISYASRVFDEKEMCSLTDAMLDFWLTAGRFADAFEKDFAERFNVRYAHLVNSGSSANLLAFMVLTAPELGSRQIKKGDEVITVACGFPTTIAPIIQYGAVPVFVDMTVPQYNIDVQQLEEALSVKTKAVMLAHTLGNPFDISVVKNFCDAHNLWLIEDNCDALGSTYTIDNVTKYTGTWGDAGAFSFYPSKNLGACGDAGAVITNNKEIADACTSIRHSGRSLGKAYEYDREGSTLRMDEIQAAILNVKLQHLAKWTENRRKAAQLYRQKLADVKQVALPPLEKEGWSQSYYVFTIRVKDRDGLSAYLKENNIGNAVYYPVPLYKQPCYAHLNCKAEDYPNTEAAAKEVLSIPMFPEITEEQIDTVCSKIKEFYNK